MAVRTALGAGRGRLIRQMLTESILLSAAAGAAGLLLARWGMMGLRQLIPAPAMAWAGLSVDSRLLLFSLGLALATGIGFGIAPALQITRLNLNDALKQGARGAGGGHNTRFRDVLVISEVAMALVLLVAAGLMIQTLLRLQAQDTGFNPEDLLTLRTTLPLPKDSDGAKRQAFYDRVLERVARLPGVRAAAYASTPPFTQTGNTSSCVLEGRLEKDSQDCLFREGTVDYLKTLGVQLREGRFFTPQDRLGALPVVIVNESFAKSNFPNGGGIGKRLQTSRIGPEAPWYTIVGVVRDVRERGFEPPQKPGLYLPVEQVPELWGIPEYLVVRTVQDPHRAVNALRQAIWQVDPEQPVSAVRSMEEIMSLETAGRRQHMILLGAFSALALLLATLGIYGVLSYAVTQRTREIGLRMALGASAASVLRMVVAHGLRLTAAGLAIGIGCALAVSRALGSLLYGVGTTDPATYAGVAVILSSVGILACVIPARRAARVDPIAALREE
jgi:predicted permease